MELVIRKSAVENTVVLNGKTYDAAARTPEQKRKLRRRVVGQFRKAQEKGGKQ